MPDTVDTEWLLSTLDRLHTAFLNRRMEEVMAWFALPCPIYSSAGLRLIRDGDEFLKLINAFRAAREETVSSRSALEVLEPIENNRFRAVISWHHFDASDRPVAESRIRYFFHLPRPDAFEIEMMEYLQMPISLADANSIIH